MAHIDPVEFVRIFASLEDELNLAAINSDTANWPACALQGIKQSECLFSNELDAMRPNKPMRHLFAQPLD
jgi:hypothetical protein